MKKSDIKQLLDNAVQFVIAHGMYKKSKGKNPSMSFLGEKNPHQALQKALHVSLIARTGAKWWADHLRGEKVAKLDNGDSLAGGLASMISKTENSDEKIDAFEQFLQTYLEKELVEHGRCKLSTDYGPDWELNEAIKATGVKVGMTDLPWKTIMWINLEGISVSNGYQAPVTELLLEEDKQETETTPLDMKDAKNKLADLESHLPGQRKEVYQFAGYLVDYLNEQLLPQGFFLAVQLAIYDLSGGINGFTGEKIDNELVGENPILNNMLVGIAPQLAYASCPEWFAKQVETFQAKVLSEA